MHPEEQCDLALVIDIQVAPGVAALVRPEHSVVGRRIAENNTILPLLDPNSDSARLDDPLEEVRSTIVTLLVCQIRLLEDIRVDPLPPG